MTICRENLSLGQRQTDLLDVLLSASRVVGAVEHQRFFLPFLLPALLFALATISQNMRKVQSLISKKAFAKLRNVGYIMSFDTIKRTYDQRTKKPTAQSKNLCRPP
jgi:hypothetical protein